MFAIMSYFNDQKIILTRPFFAAAIQHNDRNFHSHNCIEMSYVMEGTANHVLIRPDGKTEQQKICKGNYIILDSHSKHAYKNGSPDFTVMNLLFKMSFLSQDISDNKSINSSKVFSVTRSEWHDDPMANDIELKFGLNEPKTLEKKKYLRLWLDLTGEKENVDFNKACFGIIADNAVYSTEYQSQKTPFYFLGEEEEIWTTMYHSENGLFGSEQGSSVKGLRGWFAFPLDNMVRKSDGKALNTDCLINGIYFYCSLSDKKMAGVPLFVDDISLVEDYRVIEKGILNDDKIIDLDKGLLKVNVSGKDGCTAPEVYADQIKVSVFDDGDFYGLIKDIYPGFKYSKIPDTPVNQVYFDKDGTVWSLFKICHDTSRKNMHEWHNTVRHALSLIIILALHTFDKYIRPKKENIMDIIKKYVEQHYTEDITLTDICAKYFYSVPYVSHKFKETFKCSFEQYVRQLRVHHACELLLGTQLSIGEISEQCGYTSVRSFRKAFNCVVGSSPTEFKRNYNK